jgi:hypothetical protein
LRTPEGTLEAIKSAEWVRVDHVYLIEVEGFQPFAASESHTLFVDGESTHRWCSTIPSGSRVATVSGYRQAIITRVEKSADVLHVEMEGPSHKYIVCDGILTHNMKAYNLYSTL